MKKVFALTLVCAFAFAVVACGGAATEQSADTTAVSVDTVAAPAPVDTTATDTAAAQ